jgi:endonuclease YncB( thermonuclease family)
MEVGYVLQDGKDVSIELLREGLAKLRNEKSNSEHLDQYK